MQRISTYSDAALVQGRQGGFSPVGRPFRTNAAVELVFDLQQAVVELAVFAVLLAAEVGVGRMRGEDRMDEGAQIVGQTVIADSQGRLGAAAVAQVTHAQRGGVG